MALTLKITEDTEHIEKQQECLDYLRKNKVDVGLTSHASGRSFFLLGIHTRGSPIMHIPPRPVVDPALHQEGLQQETLKRFVGMEEEVLIEGLSRRSSEEISGKGLHGVSITMQGKREEIGRIIRCRVTGVKNNTLTGVRE